MQYNISQIKLSTAYKQYAANHFSHVHHCLAEEAVVPNIFPHEYHRKLFLGQLKVSLVLSYMLHEVLEHEFYARTNTEKAAAVPPADGAKLKESRKHLRVIGVTPRCSMISSILAAFGRSTESSFVGTCPRFAFDFISTSSNRHASSGGVLHRSRSDYRCYS